jgi:parallel beta-helix repeat protein
MLRKLNVVLISAGALALGACSSSTPTNTLCSNVTAPCVPFVAGTAESAIDTAIASAAAGTTFVFDTGTFNFTGTLALPAASGLTITGQGIGKTILNFSGQTTGTAGITAILGNSKVTFSKFTIQNTPGDGIKVQGATGVIFRTVQATWTSTNVLTHGAYGLYPVQCQDVLVDSCQASGARDTGIYVGQSFNIIVSNNMVHDNVAGIEIESSVNADVVGNTSTNNSGGILVFALPGLLPAFDAGTGVDATLNVRVYSNTINANNTANFGDPSGTVTAVPGGTGVVVLASSNVELFGNTITNNQTVGYAVVSYFLIDGTFDPTSADDNPTGMNPFPDNVYAHDNVFTNNGTQPIGQNQAPDGGVSQNELGALLGLIALESGFLPSGNKVPDMVWDGIALEVAQGGNYTPPAAPTNGTSAGTPPNPLAYSIQSNGNGVFANLNFPNLVPDGGVGSLDVRAIAYNATPFTVAAPPAGFPLPGVDAGLIP